jgi:NTE family protein
VAASPLARNPLFHGLPDDALDGVVACMERREFAPGDVICRAGDPGDTLFVIVDGLARVSGSDGDLIARLRRSDVIGEMSLVSGEPRSATVVAAVPTAVLELGQEDFAGLIARYPGILSNLNRILSRRLAETTARVVEERARGEAVALVVGDAGTRVVPQVLEAGASSSAAPVASLDTRGALEPALAALDDQLARHGTVLLPAAIGQELLRPVLEAVDRTIALVGDADELERLGGLLAPGERADVVVLADSANGALAGSAATPVVRTIQLDPTGALTAADAGWLGRQATRTKLGLALGAGGAKGYAHVGALAVLEEAGYTVDAVAGSSIGAIVGALLALGMSAGEIDATMRHMFRPEVVAETFKLSFSGKSTGLEAMAETLKEGTSEKTFDDVVLPLVVMTVGLDSRAPEPITTGPLWQALLAATALAGLFPPYERDGARLVDGLALVPVPTDAVVDAGADITVSVDIIGGDLMPAWPGEEPPPKEEKGPRARMLDTLLEVMDLAQLDSSRRHAARADVPLTPRFGPSTWRDFHLADLFLEAGRQAAEEHLPALQALAKPQPSRVPT